MHGCMDVWMDVCMRGCMDARMHGCMDAWMYGCMYARMYGCMDVWMHGCMDVCMDVCMDGCMHACMYLCMYMYQLESGTLGLVEHFAYAGKYLGTIPRSPWGLGLDKGRITWNTSSPPRCH